MKVGQLSDELSQKDSKLMVKEKQFKKLEEDYKLLTIKSSNRKTEDSKTILQVRTYITSNIMKL